MTEQLGSQQSRIVRLSRARKQPISYEARVQREASHAGSTEYNQHISGQLFFNNTGELNYGIPYSDRSRLNVAELCVLSAIVAFFFEGAIRKWVLPLDHPLIYACVMSKELLVFAGLLLGRQPDLPSLAAFRKYVTGFPLLITGAGMIVGASAAINTLGAILTFRSLIVLPLAACLIGRVFRPELMRPAVIIIGICILINVPLAIIQFYSSQTDWINVYVGGSSVGVATTGFSSHVRATGTFSYISGLGFGALIGLATGLTAFHFGSRFREQLFGIAVILGALVLALSTVSRGAMLACAALFLFYVLRSVYIALPLLLLAVVAALAMDSSIASKEDSEIPLRELLTAVVTRTQGADSSSERILSPLKDLYYVALEYPTGEGLGIGQTAARRFGASAVVETELARVVYEIGVLGFTGFILTYLGAIVFLWRLSRVPEIATVRLVMRGGLLVCLMLLYGGVTFNHISSMIFWGIFVGCCCLADSRLASNNIIRYSGAS